MNRRHLWAVPHRFTALCLCVLLCADWATAFHNPINDLHGGTPAPPGGSPPPPGGDPPPGGCNGPNCESEPVETFTGQYLHDMIDFSIPGRIPLRVRRLYRSGSSYQGMFGRSWNMEYNERILVLATNGNLLLRRGNSERIEFINRGSGNYAPPPGVFDSLVRNGDGTYTLREKFGTVRTYANNGCLTEVRDRNGNQLLLSYDPAGKLPISALSLYSHIPTPIVVARDFRLTRIELAHSNALTGRFLEFRYDNFGRVTNVLDFTGRSWRYEYDGAGYGTLVAVTTPPVPDAPNGLTSRYSYAPAAGYRLETLTDRRGVTFLTNRYDAAGRVIRQFWGNAVYSFAYPSATQRWVTNGNGFRIERNFDTNGNVLDYKTFTAGLRPGEPQFYQTRYAYDSNNAAAKLIYPAGNVEARRYDARGNLIETRLKAADTNDSPDDLVTASTYEPRFNLLKTATDARGHTTTYTYDFENPAQTNAPGNLVRLTYPAVGGQNYSVGYAYSDKGDLAAMTNVNGAVTLATYDPLTGYLLQRIDAVGTPVAITNRYTYDARGNLLAAVDPRGNTNRYDYDALDRRVQVTSPAPFHYLTRYTYTGTGRIAREEHQTGDGAHPWQVTTFTYDAIDRLDSVTDDLGQTTRFAYDGNGNQTRITDPGANTTTFAYDERNLLWRANDALTNTVTFFYTPNARLARRIDPRTNATAFALDRYDRLIAVTNADNSVELFGYDAAGNLTARRTRAGRWMTNAYDALGRLTEKRYADGAAVQFGYDAAARLVRAAATNGLWLFTYDALGRLVEATNSIGKRLRYQYDPAGNQTRLTYPDDTFVQYTYDNLNRMASNNYNGTRPIATVTHDPLHRRSQVDFGNGTRATYTFDYANRLAELRHTPAGGGAPLARFTYGFDAAGIRLNLLTEGTRFPGQTTFEYDRTYQLTRVQYPGGSPFPTTSYDYDRAGNRTRVTAAMAVNYVANTLNQYTSVAGQAYAYSTNGPLVSDGTWSYSFDDEDRLTQAVRTGVNAQYAYDPFNRRVTKDVNGDMRRFFYNEIGDVSMLLGESDAAGVPLVKYVFYGLSPIAMIVSNTVFTLHCDHLERPVLATDESGAVAWEAAFSAYGEPSLDPANRLAQPLRAPGQYEDPESGLQYNLARFYDTRLGRYLSEDPALETTSPLFTQVQDKNAYAYLRNNPVNGVDPNGQSVFFLVCSAGLPVCSAAILCSLNVGACSGGVICSANVGACSASVACSGSVGACSGSAGGVCSGAIACSAQLGSGLGGCSGSVVACSAQAGVYGGSACSVNIVGACSGQASVAGGSACSAQYAGACSAQVGAVGVGVCSAQGSGACSVQIGAGAAACSYQSGSACSAQYGPGFSACSAQNAGSCSSQWGFGYSGCSAQPSGCGKNGSFYKEPSEEEAMYAGLSPASRQWLSGLNVEREASGDTALRFIAHGFARVTVLKAKPGGSEWVPLRAVKITDHALTQVHVADAAVGQSCQIKMRLESHGGIPLELGPFKLEPASGAGATVAGVADARGGGGPMRRFFGLACVPPSTSP